MKLFYSTTSPYSRKTRLAVLFKQLTDQVEQIVCNPFADTPEYTHQNPLGKVPTLILDDDTTIFDSPVICEYLDGFSTTNQLYPTNKDEWINVKTAEALGDGILDAAYNIVMERRRPEGESSSDCIKQWQTEIERSLPFAVKVISSLNNNVTQAHISMYCTLGYLDFRLADLNWREQVSPSASEWFDSFQKQYPFIEETKPH